MADTLVARAPRTVQVASTEADRAHDAGRFARAVALAMGGKVEQRGPTQYRVAGNDEPYYDVDLSVDPPCYCGDMWHRGRTIRNNCKHTLAARLVAKDPTIMPSLMEYAYQLEQRKKAS